MKVVVVLVMVAVLAGCEKTGSANLTSTETVATDAVRSADSRNQRSLDARKGSEIKMTAWGLFIDEVREKLPSNLAYPTDDNWSKIPYTVFRFDDQGPKVNWELLADLATIDTESCNLLRDRPDLHPTASKIFEATEKGSAIHNKLTRPLDWEGAEFDCFREGITIAAFTVSSWGVTAWPVSPIDSPNVAEFWIRSVGINTVFCSDALKMLRDQLRGETLEMADMGREFLAAVGKFARSEQFNNALSDADLFANGISELGTGASNDFPVQAQIAGQIVGIDAKGANLVAYGKPWYGSGIVAGGSWEMTVSNGAGMTRSSDSGKTTRTTSGSRSAADIGTR